MSVVFVSSLDTCTLFAGESLSFLSCLPSPLLPFLSISLSRLFTCYQIAFIPPAPPPLLPSTSIFPLLEKHSLCLCLPLYFSVFLLHFSTVLLLCTRCGLVFCLDSRSPPTHVLLRESPFLVCLEYASHACFLHLSSATDSSFLPPSFDASTSLRQETLLPSSSLSLPCFLERRMSCPRRPSCRSLSCLSLSLSLRSSLLWPRFV